MREYTVQDGDTWDSIAETQGMVKSWLILGNALDPNASPPPEDPAAGSTVTIPDDPPGASVAPGNSSAVDVGDGGLHALKLELHDDAAEVMTDVLFSLTFQGATRTERSADGWVRVAYASGTCAAIELKWGAPDESSEHPYQTTIATDCFTGEDEDLIAVSGASGGGSDGGSSSSDGGSGASDGGAGEPAT
jgi:hypothetical protein